MTICSLIRTLDHEITSLKTLVGPLVSLKTIRFGSSNTFTGAEKHREKVWKSVFVAFPEDPIEGIQRSDYWYIDLLASNRPYFSVICVWPPQTNIQASPSASSGVQFCWNQCRFTPRHIKFDIRAVIDIQKASKKYRFPHNRSFVQDSMLHYLKGNPYRKRTSLDTSKYW